MAKKPPRRTAERILEVALELFNRLGAPNVSTTLIAAQLSISPGNLYYHYPAKDELMGALFDRYAQAMGPLLQTSQQVRDIEQAGLFLRSVLECIWDYRFLYRDLNDLLSNNRRLEQHIQAVMQGKTEALRAMLLGMARSGAITMTPAQVPMTATSMVVVLTYWLSFEYALAPRDAMQPEAAQATLLRGSTHVLALLSPYLADAQREHLLTLGSMDEPAAMTQKN
jgi:AcrR family transcriptional regulator